jgi:hypothetical protein
MDPPAPLTTARTVLRNKQGLRREMKASVVAGA